MKFCLIGCGGIVSSVHAPSYLAYRQKRPDFDLAACCDPNEARAKAIAERCGFARYYTSHMQLLEAEKPDVVAVIVSEASAASVAMDVIRAGVPMFIEKPPGKRSEDTQMLAREAAARGIPCQVAFNRRFMPVLMTMRERAPEDIQLVSYDMIRSERLDRDFSDTAVHGIDAVRYLSGADYEHVRFTYQELPEYGQGVCNILMDCTMTSGARAHLRICPMSGASLERAAIHARGRLLIGFTPAWDGYDAPGRVEDFTGGDEPAVTTFDSADMYVSNGFYAENEAFFEALRTGAAPCPDLPAAINTMLVKECIDRRQKEFSRSGGV